MLCAARRAAPGGRGRRQPAGRGRARPAADADGRRRGCCAASSRSRSRDALGGRARRRRRPPARPRRGGRAGAGPAAQPPRAAPRPGRAGRGARATPPRWARTASCRSHRAARRGGRRSTPSGCARPPRLLERRGLLVRARPVAARRPRSWRATSPRTSARSAELVTVEEELPRLAELSRMRDGLLVLDLHALTARAAGAARAPRRGAGPLVVLVDEAADTGEHAAVDVGADRLPGGAADLGAARGRGRCARRWPPRFRVSVEEARGAIREARDLSRPRASGRRRRSRSTPSPGAIRAQGARRMGRHVSVIETSARLSRPRRARRAAASSSTRSSPGSAAATACAGAWTSAPADPIGHRPDLPVGRQVGHRQDLRRRAASPRSSGSTSTASTSARSSRSTSARPRRRSRRSSTRSRPATGCCSSTRPTPSSAAAPRSRTRTTATRTSRSATCCSAWSPTTASPS